MTNSSPWFVDGPNRNRWFTELKNGGSFHGELLNNQRVNHKTLRFLVVKSRPWPLLQLRVAE